MVASLSFSSHSTQVLMLLLDYSGLFIHIQLSICSHFVSESIFLSTLCNVLRLPWNMPFSHRSFSSEFRFGYIPFFHKLHGSLDELS